MISFPAFFSLRYRIMSITRYGRLSDQYDAGDTMTDRELRKLSRAELLELLLEERRENERLRARLDWVCDELTDRKLEIAEAGSIAEAALRINGIFEAAQQAAAQYLVNVRHLVDEDKKEEGKDE